MNDTDPLDWSRKYEVLTISRLVLRSLGFTTEQITSLSDDDMQRVAVFIISGTGQYSD